MKLQELEKMTQFLWILMDLEMVPPVEESAMIWVVYLQEISRNRDWEAPDIEDVWLGAMNRHER